MPLLRGIARTAAIAGTATAVSNRVSRRQAGRWAAKSDEQAPAAPPAGAAATSRRRRLRSGRTPTRSSPSCASWGSSATPGCSTTPSSSCRRAGSSTPDAGDPPAGRPAMTPQPAPTGPMRIVVALGGTALRPAGQPLTEESRRAAVAAACAALAPVAEAHELVISHGAGPQAGQLSLQAPLHDAAAAHAVERPRRAVGVGDRLPDRAGAGQPAARRGAGGHRPDHVGGRPGRPGVRRPDGVRRSGAPGRPGAPDRPGARLGVPRRTGTRGGGWSPRPSRGGSCRPGRSSGCSPAAAW